MILQSTLIVLLFFGGWQLNVIPILYLNTYDFFNMNIFNSSKILSFVDLINYNFFVEFFYFFIFSVKVVIVCFFFIFVRALYPRFRYDQLMDFGWKNLMPLTLGFLLFTSYMITSIKTKNNSSMLCLGVDQIYSENISWQLIKKNDNYINSLFFFNNFDIFNTSLNILLLKNNEILFNNWSGNFDSFNFPTTIYTINNDFSFFQNFIDHKITYFSNFEFFTEFQKNSTVTINNKETFFRELFRIYNPKYC